MCKNNDSKILKYINVMTQKKILTRENNDVKILTYKHINF